MNLIMTESDVMLTTFGKSNECRIEKMSFQTPVRQIKRSVGGTGSPSKLVEIPPSPFMKKLGYGTGVCVYLMSPHGTPTHNKIRSSPWAVKKINRRIPSKHLPEYEKRLCTEAGILRKLKHPNIVAFKGVSRANDGSLCLCMESGERSLYDIIEDRQQTFEGPFHPLNIFTVARSIVNALVYLHCEHKLLHGDIKSANVLVKGNFQEIKLCDFGVALQLNDSLKGLKNPKDCYIGSGPWTAKEALEGEPEDISDKCDIYSYGCLLYEMLTLKIPHFQEMDDSFGDMSFDEESYQHSLGTRPALLDITYDDTYDSLIELFCCCTCENPNSRPPSSLILNVLNTIESSQSLRGTASSPVLLD